MAYNTAMEKLTLSDINCTAKTCRYIPQLVICVGYIPIAATYQISSQYRHWLWTFLCFASEAEAFDRSFTKI